MHVELGDGRRVLLISEGRKHGEARRGGAGRELERDSVARNSGANIRGDLRRVTRARRKKEPDRMGGSRWFR